MTTPHPLANVERQADAAEEATAAEAAEWLSHPADYQHKRTARELLLKAGKLLQAEDELRFTEAKQEIAEGR